jgi:hypothetical protein
MAAIGLKAAKELSAADLAIFPACKVGITDGRAVGKRIC